MTFGEALSAVVRGMRHGVTEWKRKSVPERLYIFNLFAYTPVPRHKRGRMHSFRGLATSFFIGFALLGYAIYTSVRFALDDPALTLSNDPTDGSPINFPLSGLTFRTLSHPSVTFYDERYFVYHFRRYTVEWQNRFGNATEVELGNIACNLTFAGWLGEGARCPTRPAILRGHYLSAVHNFFQIDVRPCDNATSNVTCAPRDEIDELVENGEFELLVLYDDHDGYTPESLEFTVSAGHWNIFELMHHRMKVVNAPNLVYRWTSESVDILTFANERCFIKRFNGTYLTLRAMLESQQWTETYSTLTVQDLIGSWYGFYGALVLVCSLYFGWYNEEKFFTKYPSWDNIEDDFAAGASAVVVPPSTPPQLPLFANNPGAVTPPGTPAAVSMPLHVQRRGSQTPDHQVPMLPLSQTLLSSPVP